MDALEHISRKPPEIQTIIGAIVVATVGAYVFAILSIVAHFAVVVHYHSFSGPPT